MYKWAGRINPKTNSETVISSIDMVPTVLDILDIKKPENLPGISVLNETAINKRETVFGEIYAHDFDSVETSMYYNIAIAPPYKLIVPDAIRKPNEKIQLFNIDEDPFEKNNIAENNDEVVKKLKQKIKAFRSE